MMKQQLWRKVATLLPALLFSICTMAQQHDVKGVVTDEDQLPILKEFTRNFDDHIYLMPIPIGQLDALEMSAEEIAAYQNPGY